MSNNHKTVLLVFLGNTLSCQGLQICGKEYWCDHGHCCGNGRCCTYYYEIWWFWLVWFVLALLGFCCIYLHKKRRILQLQNAMRSQHLQDNRMHRPRRRRFRRIRQGEMIDSDAVEERCIQMPMPIYDPGQLFKLPTYEESQESPPSYNLLYSTIVPNAVSNAVSNPVFNPVCNSVSNNSPAATNTINSAGYGQPTATSDQEYSDMTETNTNASSTVHSVAILGGPSFSPPPYITSQSHSIQPQTSLVEGYTNAHLQVDNESLNTISDDGSGESHAKEVQRILGRLH